MQRIIITGGLGFIGSNLISLLLKKKIFFVDGNNYEDVNFLSKVFNETKYCLKIKDICYHHIRQNVSITAKEFLLPSVVNTKFSNNILVTIVSLINFINFSKRGNSWFWKCCIG